MNYSIRINDRGEYIFRNGSSDLPLLLIPEPPEEKHGYVRWFDNNMWMYELIYSI